ncbi:AtpZ/AtpI family protein [Tannockella kyphosi]|uniref:AtpZ/AtpI family protein n=1 Tax=Tannockella kyphosi TaxID=2899121 RepID=UPI0024B3295A|nr:AtpZ/AtpI family protein [Tannockella kyphosi]
MRETVYLEPNKKILQEILFALQLGVQIIATFILAIMIGLKLDSYFNSKPTWILLCLLLAFVLVMRTLLGVIKK